MIGNRTIAEHTGGAGLGGAGCRCGSAAVRSGRTVHRCSQPDHRTARYGVADHGEAGPEEKIQRPLVEVCRTGLRPQFRVHGVALHHGGAVGKRMADGGAKERCGNAAAAVAGGDDEAAHRPDGPSA
jgi:hypothetical protein